MRIFFSSIHFKNEEHFKSLLSVTFSLLVGSFFCSEMCEYDVFDENQFLPALDAAAP